MKAYFKFFRVIYIIIAVLALIFLGINGLHTVTSKAMYHERTNTECLTTMRVFDGADVLSDKEEQKLEKLIAKREKETGCDIVLVTLDTPLKDYAREIEPYVPSEEFVRVFAEQFYEETKFGYDEPNGDGVILVDNYSREDDGMIHTWFCTTGIVKETYSDADIDHILDRVYRYVEWSPYLAYKIYVNDFYDDMMGGRVFHMDVPLGLALIIGVLAAAGFIPMNWKSKSANKTTTAVTYVNGQQADFVRREDIFLRKSVVKHRIESSSSGGGGHSGGGGGSHGGGSHGGGGHSR
ncbi:MAG: TPM domain-containing protein [Muribaculaceae bacterium]|nr:TPM domain-containing protein [Muribaculaceae bacterium]